MNKYIYEKSNNEHPGISILAYGYSARDVFPALPFFQIMSAIRETLVNKTDEFYEFILEYYRNVEESDKHHNYIVYVNKLFDQTRMFLFKIAHRGKQVKIPDIDYFAKKYNKISKFTKSIKFLLRRKQKKFAEEFYKVVKYSVDRNETEGLKLGLELPYDDDVETNDSLLK